MTRIKCTFFLHVHINTKSKQLIKNIILIINKFSWKNILLDISNDTLFRFLVASTN